MAQKIYTPINKLYNCNKIETELYNQKKRGCQMTASSCL